MEKLRVEIWSDIACPWCYIGKRRFEAALARFPRRDAVQLQWRSFELDASAPREFPPSPSYTERLAAKYGYSLAQTQSMMQRVTDIAADEGLEFRFDRVRAGNTFDAHRLLHLAAKRGLQDALKERFLLAYLTQGEPIGDRDTLARLAADVGIGADEVAAVLSTDAYASEVREDQREARAIGISGVPFFLVARRYGISGAQPPEVLLSALERAWSETVGTPLIIAEGPVCGPDGCT